MNNLMSALTAILATGLLLLFREFVLSVGKRKSNSLGRRTVEPGLPGSEVQVKKRLHPVPTRQPGEPFHHEQAVGVDEFLTELRAKAQEQLPAAKTESVSTPEPGRDQSNQEHMATAWR